MSAASFQFLHAADLHLDSPLRGLVRRGEAANLFVEASRRALENLVAAAISERAAFLVIAGDLYDGDWKDYSTGQFFVRQMGRLARAGVQVFIVRGNHDADSVITRNLPLPPCVHDFSTRAPETVQIEELRVSLHGRGFDKRRVAENVASSYPPPTPGHFNIGVLHTSLNGREGHDVYAPCAIDDLRRHGYDYWALGHVHRREVVAEFPHIVYPGNLQGRHARERGAKGATLVRVVDGRISSAEALALDAARFDEAEVDLAGVSELSVLRENARRAIEAARSGADGRPLALRLVFTGETALSAHLSSRTEQLAEDMQAIAWDVSDDVLIEKIRDETTVQASAAGACAISGFDEILSELSAEPTLRAEVGRVLKEMWSKAPADAMRLLGEADPDPETFAALAIEAAREKVIAMLNDADSAERDG